MNKSDLIEALAPRLGGRAAAAAAVEAMVDVVLREVASGGSVGITGFGTFERVDRAPRTGRNPRTGQSVPIAGTSSPRFRPGSYFKDVVADPATLPAEGSAGLRGSTTERAAAHERSGAPASVRRSAAEGRRADRDARGESAARGDRARGGQEQAADQGRGGSTRAATGTPPSVRKEPARPPSVDPTEAGGSTEQATGTGLVTGGEDITAGMISAKKAQLAKVKNDQVATQGAKKAKKAKKADKAKAGKATKAEKSTAGKAKGGKGRGKGAKTG